MPKILADRKQFIIPRVRQVIAQDHQIPLDDLADRLEREHNVHVERHYLSTLVRKKYRERAVRADRATLNYALGAYEDVMAQVVRVAWCIANDPGARKQDRVAALREIGEAQSSVFDKLFDAGVFNRKLGSLGVDLRQTPLPDERKQAIRAGLTNWGILPPPTVAEQLVHASTEELKENAAEIQAFKEDAGTTETPAG